MKDIRKGDVMTDKILRGDTHIASCEAVRTGTKKCLEKVGETRMCALTDRLWMVCGVLFVAVLLGCAVEPDSSEATAEAASQSTNKVAKSLSEHEAIAELKRFVIEDNLYPWTTIDRIAFHAFVKPDEIVVGLNEIHLGDDGADPKTHPTINFFRIDKSGQWTVAWPAPGEGWIPYGVWLSVRSDQ